MSMPFAPDITPKQVKQTVCAALCLCFGALGHSWSATVVAWGDNASGQASVPANLTNVASIAAGGFFNMALRSNGTIVVWGDGAQGQTNPPANLTNVMAVSAGYSHALALRSNGTVAVWGDNSLGGQTNMPPGLNGVKAIAACGFHSLAVRTNGTVVGWGFNDYGATNVPASATNVVAVAGGYHSLALRSNGSVVAWGAALAGQTNLLPTLTNVQAIASGLSHALALRSNGTVVAWGDNFFGQTNVPFGVQNVAAIGCGANHSFAVISNGFIVVWGRDTHFQTSGTPHPLNGVSQVSGGYFHSLALGFQNDDFVNRMPLNGTNVLVLADNLNATTEYGSGEPLHHENFTGHTVWFTWTAPASGGVVIAATNTDFSIPTPILAVYSGSALNSLTQLDSNSADFSVARVAFTAVAGQTYQIVFAGDSDFGGGQGNAYLKLTLTPPPANDLFANATMIAGNYYALAGSFIGANREASEPSHGDASLGQTLWWHWTAPANGPNPLSVRLMTDAVSFPPAVGVYTGNSLASLAATSVSKRTNGMTTDLTFNATPGTTYRIALAGKQNDADSTSPLIGRFRFRLNVRALALSITNLSATTNADGSVPFQADARVQNLSAVTSGPLRISLSSITGLSTTQPLSNAPPSTNTVLSITNLPGTLAPGQSALIRISGTAPAPTLHAGFDQSRVYGYGVFAALQEQPVTNLWFTVDETLVTFDRWPAIGDVVGPGGGVIRLDPDYLGLSAFNPLLSVNVIGAPTVAEGASSSYTGRAQYVDNTIHNFTNTTWSASTFAITTNGLFSTGIVTSNTLVTLNAPYAYGGLVYTATTNVTVLNLPAPTLGSLNLLSNGSLAMTLSGVPGRSHVLEATTNLTPPISWVFLSTNSAGTNGIANLIDFTRTNFPRRFYRAREL